MFNQYYQEQLANLRDLAAEFSNAHPALAPMLKGPSTDPDAERLLEGVAYLAALLQEKVDDEFPEIIQGLLQIVFPHYLRPLPSATIMEFMPRPNLKEVYKVPAGVSVASKPVAGTRMVFSTCYDLEVHPLKMTGAVLETPAGKPPYIRLSFELYGMDLEMWDTDKLRLYLAQDYPVAANLYSLFMNYIKTVTVAPAQGGRPTTLGPENVAPVGFDDSESMIPYPSHSFPGYRILQEFLVLPQKFLFVDICGIDRWKERGTGNRFDVIFELSRLPFQVPRLKAEEFVLFATPAINVFKAEADPIVVEHKKNEYRVRASGPGRNLYQVYSVDRVTGYQQGTVKEVEYKPFELFHQKEEDAPVYHVSFRRSRTGNFIDAMLSFTYPQEQGGPVPETLSIKVTCTNGEMAENLKVGEISEKTADSPELLDYKNIRPTTASILPPLGQTILWRFLSLYTLNFFSIANKENLKELLRLYIFPDSRDQAGTFANLKRIEGITDLEVRPADRLVKGHVMRGQQIKLKINSENFAGDGDLYLFGSILDSLWSSYSSLNSFTSLMVEDVLKGETYKWKAKMGDRPLI